MRNLKPIIILTLVFFICCKNKQNEKENTKITIDSLNTKKVIKQNTISILKVPKNCEKISFNRFFQQFGSDSIFQKSRVLYPLKELYIEDLENTKIITDTIYSASEYNYIDFINDKDSMNREYDKYTVEIKKINNNLYHYYWFGYDNGIHVTYKFKLIDNCWFLIEILDEST